MFLLGFWFAIFSQDEADDQGEGVPLGGFCGGYFLFLPELASLGETVASSPMDNLSQILSASLGLLIVAFPLVWLINHASKPEKPRETPPPPPKKPE